MTTIICLSLISSLALAGVDEAQKVEVLNLYNNLPLAFTQNAGQVNEQVKFVARGNGATIFFTATGTTFLLSKAKEGSPTRLERELMAEAGPRPDLRPEPMEREYYALKLEFVGANPNPQVVGEERLPWNNNYFIGNDPSKWRTNVPNYAKIRLVEVYEGIDLVYYGNKKGLKYDFVIKPGADPSRIVLGYEGATGINLTPESELEIHTSLGKVVERKPYPYQIIEGQKVEVEAFLPITI